MPTFTQDDYREAVRRLRLTYSVYSTHQDYVMYNCCFRTHKDSTPSLGINFVLGIYHCFSCGASGTIGNLVYRRTGKTLPQFLGINADLDELNPAKEPELNLYKRRSVKSIDIRGKVIAYYNSPEALDYIERRGITRSVADRMGMQYVNEAYFNTSHFTKRLLIPIYSENGQLMNVEGRAIDVNAEKKCLYPVGSSKPLYDWYKLDIEKPLYLFEGLIKMAVARTDDFFFNSSATLGATVSAYQYQQLNRFKEVVLVRDMDVAGEIMARKMKEVYKGKFSVLLLTNPALKDVDEIPSLKMSVKEYRENDGFTPDIQFI